MNENITNIRRSLLWERIREINSSMPEAMFQEMKALPVEKWCQTWVDAGLDADSADLAAVHGMLWSQ